MQIMSHFKCDKNHDNPNVCPSAKEAVIVSGMILTTSACIALILFQANEGFGGMPCSAPAVFIGSTMTAGHIQGQSHLLQIRWPYFTHTTCSGHIWIGATSDCLCI